MHRWSGVARSHHARVLEREEPDRTPQLSFDWTFLRDGEGQPLLTVLVGVDHRTGLRVAIPTSNRESSNVQTVKEVLMALQRFGHHNTAELRSDGEPALLALLRNVARVP